MSNAGDLIKLSRLKRGYTIDTLSGLALMGKTTIQDVESGSRSLNSVNTLRLAQILFPSNPKILYNAVAKDNNTLPIDVLQYILDNNLSNAIRIFMEKDASGDLLIDLAMQLKDRKIK